MKSIIAVAAAARIASGETAFFKVHRIPLTIGSGD